MTCEDGFQTRTRLCDNPPPAYGGDYCPNEDTQHKNCTMIMCPSKPFLANKLYNFILSTILCNEVFVEYELNY